MASWIIQENKLIMIFKQRSENPLTSFRSNQRPVLRIVQMIGAFPIVKELGERHFIHALPRCSSSLERPTPYAVMLCHRGVGGVYEAITSQPSSRAQTRRPLPHFGWGLLSRERSPNRPSSRSPSVHRTM